MKAAFILYTVLLLLEGLLAWAATGEAFLTVVSVSALMVYSVTFQGSGRRLPEGVRLGAAVLLVIGGPWRYQDNMTAMLLCFAAMPHLLAATQALWETRHNTGGVAPESARMRSMVFTVAFYAAMGLAFLLLRGVEPVLTRFQSSVLAGVVALAALPAWDRSLVLRLKPASAPRDGLFPGGNRPNARTAVILAGLLLAAAALFSGPLPVLANFLTRLSPHWRMDPIEFKNRPPNPPPGDDAAQTPQPSKTPVTRSGLDSAATGTHRLPGQADIGANQDVRLFLQPADPARAPSLLQGGRLYLRSHTLDRFREGVWEREVTGGAWREDAEDGEADGVVTLRPPGQDAVRHTVYLINADGYTLPAIQGVDALKLPRVYEIPGGVFQLPVSGNVRYEAVSSPRIFDLLPNPESLRAGKPENRAQVEFGKNEFGDRLDQLGKSIFAGHARPSDQIAALRGHFSRNFTYSTQIRNPRDLDALGNFLFSEKKGYCDFFASAATLLLRTAGLPSRIAYGYAVNEFDSGSGVFIARDHHAHSWTEIYFEGVGWTVCDFTPEANAGQLPVKTPPPEDSPAIPGNEPEEEEKSASGFDPAQFKDPAEDLLPKQTPQAKVETGAWFSSLLAALRENPWLSPALKWALLLLPALAAVFVAIRLLSKDSAAAREAAKAEKERARRELQPPYFVELVRVCAAAGHPKPDGATPVEFFQSLLRAGLPVPPLKPLIHYHCRVRYEDLPRDSEREKTFFAQIKSLEETLKRPAAGPV